MKHKVSELDGPLLDAAVAMALGWRFDGDTWWAPSGASLKEPPPYSQSWSFGGDIIDRDQISLISKDRSGFDHWRAHIPGALHGPVPATEIGPTPLIAAMRCYVASCCGDTVELP